MSNMLTVRPLGLTLLSHSATCNNEARRGEASTVTAQHTQHSTPQRRDGFSCVYGDNNKCWLGSAHAPLPSGNMLTGWGCVRCVRQWVPHCVLQAAVCSIMLLP